MKQVLHAAALVSALASSGVQAATYVADISGTGIHQTGGDDLSITWSGEVTVVTDGITDGTYTGDTLESITVVTDIFDDVFDWGYAKGQTQVAWEYFPGEFILVGPEPGASVTIVDGRLAGIDLVYDDRSSIDTMAGTQVAASTTCRIDTIFCHGVPNNYIANGSWKPRASSVPEPTGAVLLGAGLVLARLAARRRQP